MKEKKDLLTRFCGVAAVLVVCLAVYGCRRESPGVAADGVDYRETLERARARGGTERTLNEVRQAVQQFQVSLGRMPSNINELVTHNYLPEEPVPPEGHFFGIDPVRGHVVLVPRQ